MTCAKAFDPEAVSFMLLPVEDVFGNDELNQLPAQRNLASQTPEQQRSIFFVDMKLVVSPQKVTVRILRR